METNVKLTKLIVFMLMGAMSGVASIFFVGRMGGSVSSTMGTGYEMTAIAICVLGGVSTNGGKGKVDGVFLGFLAMSIITYFISLLPGLSVWSDALQGAIIIAAVVMNLYTERSAAKRALKERGALI